MSDVNVDLLFARLSLPATRIRWEAARNIAALIRSGDAHAKPKLLSWIAEQKLESKAVIGLNIIYAFGLGSHFTFLELHSAVKAPSHLSDWLLTRLFVVTQNLFPFRYGYHDLRAPGLSESQRAWFDESRRYAVPGMFEMDLATLEEMSGKPFRELWRRNWEWLQKTYDFPAFQSPRYYTRHSSVGIFDTPQREVYVSAFLRTLAYAAAHWALPHSWAERYSRRAMVLNSGLADLYPVERPDWSRDIRSLGTDDDAIARNLMHAIALHLAPSDAPVAVQVTDRYNRGYISVEIAPIVHSLSARPVADQALLDRQWVSPRENEQDFDGPFEGTASHTIIGGFKPTPLAQSFMPTDLGRFHVDIGSDIQLLSLRLFDNSVSVRVESDAVVQLRQGQVISKWVHWHEGWRPDFPADLGKLSSWLTFAPKATIDHVSFGRSISHLVRVNRLESEYSYGNFRKSNSVFWLNEAVKPLS